MDASTLAALRPASSRVLAYRACRAKGKSDLVTFP
jgi:hypothetical protein